MIRQRGTQLHLPQIPTFASLGIFRYRNVERNRTRARVMLEELLYRRRRRMLNAESNRERARTTIHRRRFAFEISIPDVIRNWI